MASSSARPRSVCSSGAKRDLGVHHAVGRQILGALACHPHDRVRGLHHPDGVGERLEVQRQVLAVGAALHPCCESFGVGRGKVAVAGLVGQLDDRGRSQAPVEVVVEDDFGGATDALDGGRSDLGVQGIRDASGYPYGSDDPF